MKFFVTKVPVKYLLSQIDPVSALILCSECDKYKFGAGARNGEDNARAERLRRRSVAVCLGRLRIMYSQRELFFDRSSARPSTIMCTRAKRRQGGGFQQSVRMYTNVAYVHPAVLVGVSYHVFPIQLLKRRFYHNEMTTVCLRA